MSDRHLFEHGCGIFLADLDEDGNEYDSDDEEEHFAYNDYFSDPHNKVEKFDFSSTKVVDMAWCSSTCGETTHLAVEFSDHKMLLLSWNSKQNGYFALYTGDYEKKTTQLDYSCVGFLGESAYIEDCIYKDRHFGYDELCPGPTDTFGVTLDIDLTSPQIPYLSSKTKCKSVHDVTCILESIIGTKIETQKP